MIQLVGNPTISFQQDVYTDMRKPTVLYQHTIIVSKNSIITREAWFLEDHGIRETQCHHSAAAVVY